MKSPGSHLLMVLGNKSCSEGGGRKEGEFPSCSSRRPGKVGARPAGGGRGQAACADAASAVPCPRLRGGLQLAALLISIRGLSLALNSPQKYKAKVILFRYMYIFRILDVPALPCPRSTLQARGARWQRADLPPHTRLPPGVNQLLLQGKAWPGGDGKGRLSSEGLAASLGFATSSLEYPWLAPFASVCLALSKAAAGCPRLLPCICRAPRRAHVPPFEQETI